MTRETSTRPLRLAACLLAGAAFTVTLPSEAEALSLTPGTYGLGGASAFGARTPGCPGCDSTVSFLAYRNIDGNDWVNDTGLAATGLATPASQGNVIDRTARWVIFYQIENNNPVGDPNNVLENFNVTSTWPDGSPAPTQPYTSGGYLSNVDINYSGTPGLDFANDWAPSLTDPNASLVTGGGTAPGFLSFSGGNPDPGNISDPSIGGGYLGALFEFPSPSLAANAFSDVLFLTTNAHELDYVWAETESPGGFGTSGDVLGVKAVPLPGSLLLLVPALAGLGFVARRRKAAEA